MNDNHAGRDFLLGLLFFATLAGLIWSTISLTGFTFEEKPTWSAAFPNVRGLKPGDAVLVSGRPTGSVVRVDWRDRRPQEERLLVTMEFETPITLYEGYRVRIEEFTVLGGRVVEIEPGSPDAPPIPLGTELRGEVGESALDALASLVVENEEDIRSIVSNLRRATDDLNEGRGLLGALLNDPRMKEDLEKVLTDASAITEDIREGRGTVGMLVNDEQVRDRIISVVNDGAAAARDFRQIAEDLAAGRGTFGALIADESMRADAIALISNLNQVSEGLALMVEDARSGRGLVGRLVADEELAENAARIIGDLAEVARRLEEGEGSLGALLAESEAYDELLAALQTLNGTLEDAREAQPISSFASLLFGTF